MRTPKPNLLSLAATLAVWSALCATPARAQEPQAQEPQPQEPQPQEPSVQARLGAGMGVGSREVSVPTVEGERRISTGIFPALDLSLRMQVKLDAHWALDGVVRYQSSLGLRGSETEVTSSVRETPMRAHHVEIGLMPVVRFGATPASVSLGFLVGYGVRALRPVVHLSVPGYSLHGPLAALELRIPFGTPRVVLSVMPQAFAWISTTQALQDLAMLEATGVALGGSAALQVALADPLSLELGYHDSRGSIASSFGTFTDVEQIGSIQLQLVF